MWTGLNLLRIQGTGREMMMIMMMIQVLVDIGV
jgi:hypothetical protein